MKRILHTYSGKKGEEYLHAVKLRTVNPPLEIEMHRTIDNIRGVTNGNESCWRLSCVLSNEDVYTRIDVRFSRSRVEALRSLRKKLNALHFATGMLR